MGSIRARRYDRTHARANEQEYTHTLRSAHGTHGTHSTHAQVYGRAGGRAGGRAAGGRASGQWQVLWVGFGKASQAAPKRERHYCFLHCNA